MVAKIDAGCRYEVLSRETSGYLAISDFRVEKRYICYAIPVPSR